MYFCIFHICFINFSSVVWSVGQLVCWLVGCVDRQVCASRVPAWINQPVRIGWCLLAFGLKAELLPACPYWKSAVGELLISIVVSKASWGIEEAQILGHLGGLCWASAYSPLNAFKSTFWYIWSRGAFSYPNLTEHKKKTLCTPPHKTQKSCQNDHRTIRFCNGLGRHPNLRFSRHSKNAFKPTFSSL